MVIAAYAFILSYASQFADHCALIYDQAKQDKMSAALLAYRLVAGCAKCSVFWCALVVTHSVIIAASLAFVVSLISPRT